MTRVLRSEFAFFVLLVLVLALAVAFVQADTLTIRFIEGGQYKSHRAVIDGVAGDPWQYRILSEYIVEIFIGAFRKMKVHRCILAGFIGMRVVQNIAMLSLSAVYYRRLGLSRDLTTVGLSVIAFACMSCTYDTDLTLNTYTDVVLYLAAVLLVMTGREVWILPIVVLGALNRDTSGLIPALVLVTVPIGEIWHKSQRRRIVFAAVTLALWAAVFVGVRVAYGPRELIRPYGHSPGIDLLGYNLFRYRTWAELVHTFAFIPLVAMRGWLKSPVFLRNVFWVIVPVWMLVHWFGAVIAETRLLIVPFVLVAVPMALFALIRNEAEQLQPLGGEEGVARAS